MTLLKRGAAIAAVVLFPFISSFSGEIDALPLVGGIAGWTDIIDGGTSNSTVTTVAYDSSATTDSTMKVTLIRDAMADADKGDDAADWQTAAAVAVINIDTIGSAYSNLQQIIIKYKVASDKDTVKFSLEKANNDGIHIGATDWTYGSFRAVLNGTAGEFVTDTLELADFIMDWGDPTATYDTEAKLTDNLDFLNDVKGICFQSERDNLLGGDTLTIEVSSLMFIVSGDIAISPINQFKNNMGIKISTAQGKISLDLPESGEYSISFITLNGKEIANKKGMMSKGITSFNTKSLGLAAGTYAVSIKSPKGNSSTNIIVK